MIPLLYLTDKANSALIPDETGIEKAFAAAGVRIDVRVWDEADWSGWRNILIRTPWDYARKADLFRRKISEASARGANLIHSERIVNWNIDKRYLVELSKAGRKVVPTFVEENFSAACLPRYFADYGTLVLKPSVGAGGLDTFKVSAADPAEKYAALEGRGVLVQPFVPEIETLGEHSFIFFNEEFSHAVVKRAKSGEFRVQDDHGGTVHPYTPSAGEIASATEIIKSVGLDTVYARVDAVRWRGEYHLMELEILEPELFFRFSQGGMDRFAAAVRARLKPAA
jgi:glutathione synthase/RimK-type ligase-like ATP-grasp enzyme